MKKHDLVCALTDEHNAYLKESNRNKEGRPRSLKDEQEHYLAIMIHLGETMEKAGGRFGVSDSTAQRIYDKYRNTFPEERKKLPRKKSTPKSS